MVWFYVSSTQLSSHLVHAQRKNTERTLQVRSFRVCARCSTTTFSDCHHGRPYERRMPILLFCRVLSVLHRRLQMRWWHFCADIRCVGRDIAPFALVLSTEDAGVSSAECSNAINLHDESLFSVDTIVLEQCCVYDLRRLVALETLQRVFST